MKKTLLLVILALQSSSAFALLPNFTKADGHTNWQHIANFTGSVLLILLSIVSIYLYIARRKAYKANLELTAIRNELEERVQERTATLKQSNQLLEDEVSQHVITADHLRSSEFYIKDILTSMPLMLVGLDKDCNITQWNKQVEEMSGITQENALGKTLWEAYPKTTVRNEHVQQAINENKIIHLKQSMRSLYHFDITIYPLQEKEAGVVILIDDVSKQTAAKNMLIHNDKMSFMGELASTMAHDINLPLQAIMMDLRRFQRLIGDRDVSDSGHTHEQLEQSTTEDQSDVLNSIITDMSSKGDQVSSIISNLLDFSRSRSGKKQKVDIVDVMQNTIRLANDVISLSGDLPFSDIKIERSFEKNLPLVPCYVTELQQVFLSLFRHACHALALKNEADFVPTIKVILSENYDDLWIKIQHNGLGLNAEEQMNLFEPFFTNKSKDESGAESFDSSQRLSFSHYIVTEQHQGNMAVTSDIELGSTIHIQLPVRH
jgi:PAS domain S-box-containing protein